ncbi:MAG: ComEC/Rec2 family competence protein [Candidatus Halichondribacter symbioticus]
MKIEIFDVEAGQCAMIHCPNGNIVMIDAGDNTKSGWKPSEHLKNKVIELLIISNYDEDHVSDLTGLTLSRDKVRILHLNDSVNAAKLKSLKDNTGGMGDGTKVVYDWLKSASFVGIPKLGDVKIEYYCNEYEKFSNSTNNLSVVTFVRYGKFTILFPGDLQVAGWKELLKDRNFQDDLNKVNILVASHHGREDGYCEDVFEYCNPELIIISDGKKKYETQEKTPGWYEKKALGIKFTNGTNRSVLTTRKDGNITIDVPFVGDWGLKARK